MTASLSCQVSHVVFVRVLCVVHSSLSSQASHVVFVRVLFGVYASLSCQVSHLVFVRVLCVHALCAWIFGGRTCPEKFFSSATVLVLVWKRHTVQTHKIAIAV